MILNKNEIVLLLGTNLGDRIAHLDKAKRDITEIIGPILKESTIYESASWGYNSSNKFLNQVIIIQYKSTPFDLLELTQNIEKELGKTSNSKIEYSDRPIDIDILFFENQIVKSKQLVIPHPEIQNRRFTLVPLCDILRKYQHPTLGYSLEALLTNCKDQIEPTSFVSNTIQ